MKTMKQNQNQLNKTLDIELQQVTERKKLYKNTNLKIKQGITILIGNNGSGKTYCLKQIKEKYKHAYLIDIVKETQKAYTDFPDGKDIGKWIMASEGQRVYDNLEDLATMIGRYIRYCNEKDKDVILLLDGCDSGVSPDLLKWIRDFLDLIDQDTTKNDQAHYIIVTANNYELIKDYNCIWIPDLSEYRFNSNVYEDYQKWVSLYFKD